MSVDQAQFAQSATQDGPSSAPGSVAPPPVEQAYQSVPEANAPATGSQPVFVPDQQAVPEGQSPPPPEADYRAELERERQLRVQREQENQRYQQVFQQFQTGLQQQEAARQDEQERAMIAATAASMGSEESANYIKQQMALRDQRKAIQFQQHIQERDRQAEQQVRAIAAPQYADHLIAEMKIPPAARDELLNLRDPDLMYQQAPVIKARWDQWERERAQWTQSQRQVARAQEVTALRQNGLTQMGGQNGGGSWQIEVSDDPDVKAMQVLAAQRRLEQTGRP